MLRTADLMREMVIAEEEYVVYFKSGTVHSIPTTSIPFKVNLLSDVDSISLTKSYTLKAMPNSVMEVSDRDTTFQVKLGAPFVIDGVGVLKLERSALVSNNKSDEYGFSIMPIRKATDGLIKALTVEVTNKLVSTIDLTLDHSLPRRGEQLLAVFIQKYMGRNLHDKNVIADSTLAFINTRLSKITEELAGVEDRISGYKQSTKLADITEQSKILLQESAGYNKSLAEVEAQLAMLDALSSYLQSSANPRVVPSSVLPQDVAFNALVTKYNELVLHRERLLLANTEDNPLVQNVTSQIAGLRQDMINNVGSTRRNLDLTRQKKCSNVRSINFPNSTSSNN